jgi:hypothetical protein
MYSGVAPIGTCDSYTTRPTCRRKHALEQVPTGSTVVSEVELVTVHRVTGLCGLRQPLKLRFSGPALHAFANSSSWMLHLGPLANGVEVDATVDQRSSDIAPPCPQGVGAQRDRPLLLVLLQIWCYADDRSPASLAARHRVVEDRSGTDSKTFTALISVRCTRMNSTASSKGNKLRM